MTARCLETRRTPEGFKRRRYEFEGVRFWTMEVPMSLWEALNPPAKAQRRDRGVLLLREGWKPHAVAHELGVSESTVRKWGKAADR